jgi:hypothetical protein
LRKAESTHRLAWLSLASALAVCGSVCGLLACVGALFYFLSLTVSDADGSSWFFALLAYPAYAFRKWARAAWRAGAGTKDDWNIAYAVVAMAVTLLVALFGNDPEHGMARIVGFAFVIGYFFLSSRR